MGCPRRSVTVTSTLTTETSIFSTSGGGAATGAADAVICFGATACCDCEETAKSNATATTILRMTPVSCGWSRAISLRSPYLTCLASHHWSIRGAVERLLELWQIGNDPVDAVLPGRMRIRDRVRAQILRTLVLARPLRESDEESLIGREAIDRFRLVRIGRFPGQIREQSAAEIGDVFTRGQLRIDLDVVDDRVARVLLAHAIDALLERLRIRGRPPVLEISLRVELPPFVIERVRQLVANRRAGVAVVRRVVHLWIVKRRLQHAGREVDVVHLRVVVRIDGRRRHAPLAPVDRLPDLVEIAL